MAIQFSTNDPRHPGTWQGSESPAVSTATAFTTLNPNFEVSFIPMSTGTDSRTVNKLSLTATGNGQAVEGMEKLLIATATGFANVFIESSSGRMSVEASLLAISGATAVDAIWASATGMWLFQSADDALRVKFMNGVWEVIGGKGCTMTTSTV